MWSKLTTSTRTRHTSVNRNDRRDPAETEKTWEDVLKERRSKKNKSRVCGPIIETFACEKKEHIAAVAQVKPEEPPLLLSTPKKTPRTLDFVPLTEEGLDDWFAQSQNRKIDNLILSKKEYFVYPPLVNEMKTRWSQKPRPFVIKTAELEEGQDKRYYSLYHYNVKFSPRWVELDPSRLEFKYSLLVPKKVEGGTPAIQTAQTPGLLDPKVQTNTALSMTQGAIKRSKGINEMQAKWKKARSMSRPVALLIKSIKESNSKLNDRPESNGKSIDNSPEKKKPSIPYYKNAADMLRDEELMKENESFLQKLVERLHSDKGNKKESQDPIEDYDLKQYATDLRTQKMTFERNIHRKIGLLAEQKKEEINEFVRSFYDSKEKESVEAFSRVKKMAHENSPRKIPENILKKILPKDKLVGTQQRNPISRPVTPQKPSSTLMARRSTHRNTKTLNKTMDVMDVSVNDSREDSPYSKRMEWTNRSGSFRGEASGCYLSKKAKERFVDNFFNNQGSSQTPRKIFSSEGEREIQARMEQEVSRRVSNALNKVDSVEKPGIADPAKAHMRGLKLGLDKLRIQESALVEQEQLITSSKKNSGGDSTKETADFWFIRGMMQMNRDNFYNAIDCFKQVLLVCPTYFLCIFNIGCMYERLKNYEAAKKWLQLSYDCKFCRAECLYGLALCAFKSEDAQGCFEYLTMFDAMGQQTNSSVEYLRAMCAKELGKNEIASEAYKKVNKEIQKQIGYTFAKKMMASLLFKNRNLAYKVEPKELDDFYKDTEQYLVTKKTTFVLDGYYTEGGEWKPDFLDTVAQKLSKMKFWCRFPMEYLKTFLGYMTVEKFKTATVRFIRKDFIFVLLSGTICLRDHSRGYLTPDIVAYLQEGNILGYEKIDNQVFKKPENWLICQSDVEVLVINREDFERIWEAQKTVNKMIYLDILRETSLFKNITQQTLYIIGYEIAKKEVYKAKDIVYNDNSYLTAQDFHLRIKKRAQTGAVQQLNNYIASTTAKEEASPVSKGPKAKGNVQISGLPKGNKHNEASETAQQDPLEKIVNRGIFVILSGECTIEAGDGYACTTLTRGDFFGESLLLGTKAYNNFGLIRCKTENTEVLFISRKDFWRIPRYDVEKMIENCHNRRAIRNLVAILESHKKNKE